MNTPKFDLNDYNVRLKEVVGMAAHFRRVRLVKDDEERANREERANNEEVVNNEVVGQIYRDIRVLTIFVITSSIV